MRCAVVPEDKGQARHALPADDADLNTALAGPVGNDTRLAAVIMELTRLSDSVLRVRLKPAGPFEYRAGQFITIFRSDGLARSYSIASLPAEGVLELHVRVLVNGRMSRWLADESPIGVEVLIQGPSGECFYLGGREDQPLLLAGTGLVIAVSLGLWQGIHAGWRHGSRFDRFSTGTSLVLWSVPTFWLGLLLLMVFAAGIGPIPGIFPTRGSSSVDKPDGFAGVLDVAQHMVLTCLTLVAVVYAQYLLVMRSSVIDEVGQDYITTARAKGLRDDDVRRKHAVPNALLPTVTLVFMGSDSWSAVL